MSLLPDPYRQPEFYAYVPTKRLVAWVIDTIVILALSLLAVVLTAFVGAFFWVFLYTVIGFAYRVVTITNGSATWGMRFAGIELRNAWGERLDMGTALAHTAGYTVSIILPILQVISIVMMLTSPRKQGLTDAFLGTAMINRRA
ncbi:RDD family protein [Jhaorihella thermophila]|uniref:RDD family protein n=1 Tax=Jhaorihella thermophila TaxID=488547 RepID=A0A1H5RR43_9RHOB|nr:RDD family protein [Jhaorihella thermophila]SEF39971.1 RDD family protein [Jhaorihella thermophila]